MSDRQFSRRTFLRGAIAACAAVQLAPRSWAGAAAPDRLPNIVLILADDLGYGDLGCYGQQLIQTPNLDRMAAEGMRFTQCYAGSTVCAPSRASLMTGRHTGHATVRGNGAVEFLGPGDRTVAEVLNDVGYDTACFGKWGLGDWWSNGAPRWQGFDRFVGYVNHLHAHNYYPSTLYWNEFAFPVPGNSGAMDERQTYAPDLFGDLARAYVTQPHSRPYFLMLADTTPHANTTVGILGGDGLPVPDDAPYSGENWPQVQKNYAAMITRLDQRVGQLLDLLRNSGDAENTLVIFASDNGPHREARNDPDFFDSTGGLRGIKRDLYEGGIRVPMIAWWPGKIAAGAESDLTCAFWDLLPTFAELADAPIPGGIDGISLVPELLGDDVAGRPQEEHEYLYWEFDELGFRQALRAGNWKVVRPPDSDSLELFNLAVDPGETTDLARTEPAVLADMTAMLESARQSPSLRRVFRFRRPFQPFFSRFR